MWRLANRREALLRCGSVLAARGQPSRAAPAHQGLRTHVAIEEQHVAMPHLYGAPAYARPPRPVDASLRPFDPDALPLAADMSAEERAFVATIPDRAWNPGGGIHLRQVDDSEIRQSA